MTDSASNPFDSPTQTGAPETRKLTGGSVAIIALCIVLLSASLGSAFLMFSQANQHQATATNAQGIHPAERTDLGKVAKSSYALGVVSILTLLTSITAAVLAWIGKPKTSLAPLAGGVGIYFIASIVFKPF